MLRAEGAFAYVFDSARVHSGTQTLPQACLAWSAPLIPSDKFQLQITLFWVVPRFRSPLHVPIAHLFPLLFSSSVCLASCLASVPRMRLHHNVSSCIPVAGVRVERRKQAKTLRGNCHDRKSTGRFLGCKWAVLPRVFMYQ